MVCHLWPDPQVAKTRGRKKEVWQIQEPETFASDLNSSGSAATHRLRHTIRPAAFDLHEPSGAFLPSQCYWDAGAMVNPSLCWINHQTAMIKKDPELREDLFWTEKTEETEMWEIGGGVFSLFVFSNYFSRLKCARGKLWNDWFRRDKR